MNTDKLSWIRARSNCCLPRIFEQLCGVLQRSVDEANTSLGALSDEPEFQFELNDNKEICTVLGHACFGPIPHARFALAHESIHITGTQLGDNYFSIRCSWSVEHDVCRIYLDGEITNVADISRKFLEPLFFNGR